MRAASRTSVCGAVFFLRAGREGIEPSFTASKAAVLPLDDLPMKV